ncbi:putative N-acetyltransferase HLS1 [Prunus yedoensis var. nudiflora]|uniref:Putative N-acetyltransferase HLS1 n=1 Tax=Prunus yedoensis var. nudiflora TaxID=2094558 RepID=A0A314YT88_PRUYE|nr:putative N-acetyltransferase HLS1 [Prunus yedoensis var. nudiflora]
MGIQEPIIRSYDGVADRGRVEDLERRCEVGPSERVFLFTDTMGDPICRIRNSPMHKMLVAELDNQLVGVIQGSIKLVTFHPNKPPPKDQAKVGYILGLRVSPLYRRKGIGSSLVRRLEEWTPAILVNPVRYRPCRVSSGVEIAKLRIEEAVYLYRKFMASTEFFSHDIDKVLGNKLSLGTWVAYPRGDGLRVGDFGSNGDEVVPSNWAMLSVWNSGELFNLRLGKAPLSCLMYAKSWKLMDRFLPCFKLLPSMPDFFTPFGFYFMYGLHHEGPLSGKLVRNLCQFVHNMAANSSSEYSSKNCKVVVTEVGGCDPVKHYIPHWKLLSCSEDLWCIKPLKNDSLHELTKTHPTKSLFVDPREV